MVAADGVAPVVVAVALECHGVAVAVEAVVAVVRLPPGQVVVGEASLDGHPVEAVEVEASQGEASQAEASLDGGQSLEEE